MHERRNIDGYVVDRRLSIDEAESEHMVTFGRLWWKKRVPFGYCNDEWRKMVAGMTEGDQLWHYNAPQEEWDRLMGLEAILLVRNDKVIDSITIAFN